MAAMDIDMDIDLAPNADIAALEAEAEQLVRSYELCLNVHMFANLCA